MCVEDGVWQRCVKDGVCCMWQTCVCVCERGCVAKMVCDKGVWQRYKKMVCDKNVCERWCETKVCVKDAMKDGVWWRVCVWNIWTDVKLLLSPFVIFLTLIQQGVDAWSGSHPPTKTLPFHGDMTKGRLCHVPANRFLSGHGTRLSQEPHHRFFRLRVRLRQSELIMVLLYWFELQSISELSAGLCIGNFQTGLLFHLSHFPPLNFRWILRSRLLLF